VLQCFCERIGFCALWLFETRSRRRLWNGWSAERDLSGRHAMRRHDLSDKRGFTRVEPTLLLSRFRYRGPVPQFDPTRHGSVARQMLAIDISRENQLTRSFWRHHTGRRRALGPHGEKHDRQEHGGEEPTLERGDT
jgi:hypothetical protein